MDVERLKARAGEIGEREERRLLERTSASAKLHQRAVRSLPKGVSSNFQANDPYPVLHIAYANLGQFLGNVVAVIIGVAMWPGATALTVMPSGASSSAITFVSIASPAFAAQYAPAPASGSRSWTDVMFTIRPPRAATMWRAAT